MKIKSRLPKIRKQHFRIRLLILMMKQIVSPLTILSLAQWRIIVVLVGCLNWSTLIFGRILVEDKNSSSSSSSSIEPGATVGRAAAQKYFAKDLQSGGAISTRLLSLHVGGYLNSKAYQWGAQELLPRAGVRTTGVTYKIGEWTQTMDLNLRVDYFQFEVETVQPIKISFLPLLTFPDSGTRFPLYFGVGAGPGIFLSQLAQESKLSLDYQLIFGLRWTDLWNKSGFFIESGIKDHLHVFTDGQFSSQFLTAGAVFEL